MMRHARRLSCSMLPMLLVAALAGCSSISLPDTLNPFASNAPKMAELTPIEASATLSQSWSYKIGKAEGFAFYPAIVGDSVYVAAADGSLARLEGGQPQWRIKAAPALTAGVGSDGTTVVVGMRDGSVLAFSAADGSPKWQAKVSSEVLAPPLVSGDLVLVRSGDNRVFAFDQEGKRKWLYQRPTPALSLRNSAPMVEADRFILVGFPSGKLVALARNNGAPAWEGTVAFPKGATELDRVADVVAPLVTAGPLGCAVAYQGKVTCFDFSRGGTALWSRDMSSSAGLALDARGVFVTDEKGAIQAMSLDTGGSLWKQDKLFNRRVTGPLAIGRNHLAVADVQGVVHLLNRDDGAFAARFVTDGSPIIIPPQRLGSQIIVQTQQGGVYALDIQ